MHDLCLLLIGPIGREYALIYVQDLVRSLESNNFSQAPLVDSLLKNADGKEFESFTVSKGPKPTLKKTRII